MLQLHRGNLLRNWFIVLSFTTVAAFGEQAAVDRARKLYDRTQYSAALSVLNESDSNSSIQFLRGKALYMLQDYKKATEALERAVEGEPNNSTYYHWLGKTYGRRAETASPFTAPGYALKTRSNFEKAVELDNRNLEAINDLMEYYLEAPAMLGGGVEKATRLVNLIQRVDPVEYHWALATIAERKKDPKAAEEHLRRAMELAPLQVSRVLDLAKFYSKQGRVQESESFFAKAEKMAPDTPKVLFEHANSLIRTKTDLPAAKVLLERYLKSNIGPEDPPRERAQKLLESVKGA